MKRIPVRPSLMIAACISFWTISVMLLAVHSFSNDNSVAFEFLPITLMIAVLLTFATIFILVFGLSTRDPKREDYTHNTMAKVFAGLIVACLVVSTATAIRSLWFSPFGNDFGDRFMYENIATGAGFTAIALTILLSAIQKDIYWVNRKKTVVLDERQLHERREIFEASYKASAVLVLASAIWLSSKLWTIPEIIANHYDSVPGHIYWLAANITVTIFAMPLILAAWRKSVR